MTGRCKFWSLVYHIISSELLHSRGMPRLHPRDAANWQSLTQLRHWLNELERDASLTVDLCDRVAIRDMINTVQVSEAEELHLWKALETSCNVTSGVE